MYRKRFCHLLLLTLILFCPLLSSAEPLESPPENTGPSLVDRSHESISASLINVSQWFDNFFNDPRVDEEPVGTLLRLRGSTTITEGEGVSFKGKVKVRLELPQLKQRFHLIFSSDDDDLQLLDGTTSNTTERLSSDSGQTSLGLQYTKRPMDRLIFSHRLSVRLEDGINPRWRSRARYTQPLTENTLLNFTQAVFWEKVDGLGQENRIDFDYGLRENMLLRTTGRGIFSETSNGYEWLAMQQLLTSFSHKKALTIGAFAVGETRPDNHVTEYALFSEYRQRFIKKWFYFELTPEISWPRDQDFKAVTAFTLTLEVRFGNR